MTGEDVEHLLAVLDTAAGAERVSQHRLACSVVQLLAKRVKARIGRPAGRPARERARDLDHVVLRVAAVDAEGVQLEQLAPVVLVQPPARAEMIVEVEQHGRAVRHRAEEIAKMPKSARAERVAVPHDERFARRHLAAVDREMILPEIRDDLEELPFADLCADDLAGEEQIVGRADGHEPDLELIQQRGSRGAVCWQRE